MLAEVHTDRMFALADFLETVPPEDFSLRSWQSRAPIDAIRLGPIVFRKGCGFSGCAMGWAAYSGRFPGLRINRDGVLVYRGASEFSAAAKFLGVTGDFAYYLFTDEYYPSSQVDPDDVAKRLRRAATLIEAARSRRQVPRHEPEVLALVSARNASGQV